MSKTNELEDFVNGLVEPVKIAQSDLDSLSLHELEAIIGIDLSRDDEKVAYLDACVKSAYGDDRYGSWLDQFEGSPLKAKALQLCEQELALEQERLQRRIERDATMKEDSDTWTKQDMLRLQKDMLMLELHKSKSGAGGGGADPTMQPQVEAAEPEVVEEPPAPAPSKPGKTTSPKEGKTASLLDAIKRAGVQTVGQINNGDPNQPEWPRATLGVDSAGRRATPEEAAQQSSHGMPDVAHVQPETGDKSAGAATQLGEAVMKHVDRMPGVAQRALGHAHNLGARLGGKTTEQAMGRGLMAAGGAAAAGAAGAGALATRKKESSDAAAEAARGLPFGGETKEADETVRTISRVVNDPIKKLVQELGASYYRADRGVDAVKQHLRRNALAGGVVGGVSGGLASGAAMRAGSRKKDEEPEKKANALQTITSTLAKRPPPIPVSAIRGAAGAAAHTTPAGLAAVGQGMAAKARGAIPTSAVRGAVPPPIPAAARAGGGGGLFTPAPGPSPFSGRGTGPAPKLAPARPPSSTSLSSPEFLARHPSTRGVLESVEAQNELAGKGQQGLAIARRFGMGGAVEAQQLANANAPRLQQMARSMGIKESAKLARAKAA